MGYHRLGNTKSFFKCTKMRLGIPYFSPKGNKQKSTSNPKTLKNNQQFNPSLEAGKHGNPGDVGELGLMARVNFFPIFQ